jgi:magnesium-transporting ATPase (P-type)
MKPEQHKFGNFLNCITVCQDCTVKYNRDTKTYDYSATSEDEITLLKLAASLDYKFVDRTQNHILLMIKGKPVTYNIQISIPYNSNRKMMSVIVKDPQGYYSIFSKGAEHIMLKKCLFRDAE